MLNLEDILNRTAIGVAAREQEMKGNIERELQEPRFKELWETFEHHIGVAADRGLYAMSLERDMLEPMSHSTFNKVSSALKSFGFKVESSRNYIVVTWAEQSLATDRREMLYRVKYGSILP